LGGPLQRNSYAEPEAARAARPTRTVENCIFSVVCWWFLERMVVDLVSMLL
jgi:hypothetical protein